MECNSYEMCKLLLEYKASAKLTNNIGKTLIASFIDNENILNINSWIINNMNVPDKKIWEAGKSEYLSQLKNEFK